jgi:hypothetical protein
MIDWKVVAESIANSFKFPVTDVMEAILASKDKTIDDIIEFCEKKKEISNDQKEQ